MSDFKTILRPELEGRLQFTPEWVAQLPIEHRIAMARELLEGTGMVVVPQPMSLAECFEEYHRRAAIMDEAIMREAQDPTP